MIFTITTCLHLPGKKEQTKKCLECFFNTETNWKDINKFILINEYDPEENDNVSDLKVMFPQFECIQKTKEERGQSCSINIILDILRKNQHEQYWIHWEESWFLREPFLRDGLKVLSEHKEIGQLQIAKGWDDVPHESRDMVNVVSLDYHELCKRQLGTKTDKTKWQRYKWPMFSLQPGIDNIRDVINIGDFIAEHNTVPEGKVNGSEFNFSHRWFLQNKRKGVLTPYRAFRDINHKSTSYYIKN